MSQKVSRRKFLHLSAFGAAGLIMASCAPAATPAPVPTAQVITQQVEITRIVAGTPVKEVQIVTATPVPTKAPAAVPDLLGKFPRRETFVARILTGRVGTPDNFNQWVGWKWQDRGMQNLADEPLWSVDFATGKIITGTADGDPKYTPDFKSLTVTLRKGVAWSDGVAFQLCRCGLYDRDHHEV